LLFVNSKNDDLRLVDFDVKYGNYFFVGVFMSGKKNYIIIIVVAVIITMGAGIFVYITLSDQGDNILHTEDTPPTSDPDYDNSDSETTTPQDTQEQTTNEESSPTDENEYEDVLPVFTSGPIRWHTYPTWAFDQVFNFHEGMAGVEYFEESGDWHSLHILGYMNIQGEIIIPVDHTHYPMHYVYRGAPPFTEERVAIMCNDRGGIGVYDLSGNLVAPIQFEWAWAYSDGLMAVRQGGWVQMGDDWEDTSRWGFIDRYGNIAIPLEFEQAGDFSEGLAPVMRDGYWGFINTSGEIVIPFVIEQAHDDGMGFIIYPRFSDGLVAISTGRIEENEYGEWVNNVRWGYMDQEGNMAIPFWYTSAGRFINNRAVVALGGWGVEEHEEWGTHQRFGVIDREGNIILSFEYSWVRLNEYDIIIAALLEEWDHITAYDRNGNQIVQQGRFGSINEASEGLSSVREVGSWGDTSWGFIDINGYEAIPFLFDEVRDFSQGFAAVSIGGWDTAPDGSNINNAKWGFVDTEGNIVVPMVFCDVRDFSEGLAWVRMGDYWGLLQVVEG